MTSRCFHIFLALLVGLWAPLCCCQVELFATTTLASLLSNSNPASAATEEAHGCCERCRNKERASPPAEQSGPSQSPQRDPCDDCPACSGTAMTVSGTDQRISLPAFDTLALDGFIIELPNTPAEIDAPRARRWTGPPRSSDIGGRAVLRRQCALII